MFILVLCFSLCPAAWIYKSKNELAVSGVCNLQAPKKGPSPFLVMLIFPETEGSDGVPRQREDSVSCDFGERTALKEASEECCAPAEFLDATLPS